jgi:hypothetical protein
MTFTTKPTVAQVRQYVTRRYPPDLAEVLLAKLSRLSQPADDEDESGWIQAAMLIHWEEKSDRAPESLDRYVDEDRRDFLRAFGGGPFLNWCHLFSHQPEE